MVKASVDAIDIDPKTGTTLGFYTFGTERPNILIIAGMDGLSASGMYASYLIMKHLEQIDRIDGSITVLPVSNPLAFRLGTKVSPLDSKDMDSVFPGNEHGTVTERIAWEIWRRAVQADYVIELRTGLQACVSHVIAMHREYIHVRNLASQISLPLVIESSGIRGSLTTEGAHEGIPTVSIEMRGSKNEIDSQAAVEVREAIVNLMRIKDMIPGDKIETSSIFTGMLQHINTKNEGFFVPKVNLGEVIREDDVIGEIQGKGPMKSPYDGAVVSLARMNYVFEGDIIGRIAAPLVGQWIPKEEEDTPFRRKW
ncbi:MAG: hypothetical protein GF411_02340 [Candidatus Lokiarchaeota archaeon]|nr:hypothetical protein [Candidatus Lokiarchaeota archaeon]